VEFPLTSPVETDVPMFDYDLDAVFAYKTESRWCSETANWGHCTGLEEGYFHLHLGMADRIQGVASADFRSGWCSFSDGAATRGTLQP